MASRQTDAAEPRDFPVQRAAAMITDSARDAAGAWAQPVTESSTPDVTWNLHKALESIGKTLWRVARYRPETGSWHRAKDPEQTAYPLIVVRGPDGFGVCIPENPRESGLHIRRAGYAAVKAGNALLGTDILKHVHHQIAIPPPGNRPCPPRRKS